MKIKESGTKDPGTKDAGMKKNAPMPAQSKAAGKLKEINMAQSWFTLEDGSRFEIGKGASLAGKPGDSVNVVYELKAGKKIATRVGKAG